MTNTHPSQIRGSRFHGGKLCAAFGAIGLALLGASQVQAGPSANGAVHAVTGMANANYHATKNCGDGVTVMTPQPGTDLMPVDESNIPPEMDTLYRRAARQHVKWLDTVECGKTDITFANYTSNIWSGYQIGGGAATANHYVQSGWYVPTVSIPAYAAGYYGKYYSGIWAGLGGGINSNYSSAHPLIQAGTAQEIDIYGNTNYYFWYQIYPQQPTGVVVSQTLMPVHPGDNVAGGGSWIPGSNTAVMGLCNWNTNLCVNFNVPGVPEPSNTTEWIVEAPSVGNVPQPLPAFTPIYFYNSAWAATTTYSTSSQSGIPGPIGGPSSVTGSTTPQPITADPSLSPIWMYFTPYSSTSPIASPDYTNPSQYGGTDFYVYY